MLRSLSIAPSRGFSVEILKGARIGKNLPWKAELNKNISTIEDWVLKGLNDCIITVGMYCKEDGYHGRWACNRIIRKTSLQRYIL